MRSFVLVLVALLVAAAIWSLTAGDAPPLAAPRRDEPVRSPATTVEAPAAAAEPRSAVFAPAALPEAATPAPVAAAPEALPGAVFLVVGTLDEPIAGAKVQAIAGERDLATARTDATGLATLRGVPPDAGHRVRADGYWPVTGTGSDPTTTTRVVMQRAPMLTGTVFGPAGELIARASVRLMPTLPGRLVSPLESMMSPYDGGEAMHAATDDSGRFEGPWPDDAVYDLVVDANGHAPGIVAGLRCTTQGSTPVIVRLQAGATLSGAVLRADGVPLVGARVEVATLRETPHAGVGVLGPPSRARMGQPLASGVSAARGTFTFTDLPAVPVVVALEAQRGTAAVYATLAPGQTTRVELKAADNATVTGEVSGAAAVPVRVFLYGGAHLSELGTTDGRFVFSDVPPGRYLVGAATEPIPIHLHVVLQDFLVHGATTLAATVDLAPGERRNVVLPPAVVSTGTVTGTASIAGAPASGRIVALEPLTGSGVLRRQATVDPGGAFRIETVPPGDYDAKLWAEGDRKVLAEARCRVRAGDTTPITLLAP